MLYGHKNLNYSVVLQVDCWWMIWDYILEESQPPVEIPSELSVEVIGVYAITEVGKKVNHTTKKGAAQANHVTGMVEMTNKGFQLRTMTSAPKRQWLQGGSRCGGTSPAVVVWSAEWNLASSMPRKTTVDAGPSHLVGWRSKPRLENTRKAVHSCSW